MNHSTQLSLLLLISFIFISHAVSLSPSPTPNTNLYEVVCNDAGKDHDRCMKLTQDNPKITSAKDYPTLCTSVLDMAMEKGRSAQNEIKKLVEKYPSSEAIKECATGHYDHLVYSFQSAKIEVYEDPLTASYDAKVAGDGPALCQTQLDSEHIVDPTVNALNNDMIFLSMVAFYATNHLQL